MILLMNPVDKTYGSTHRIKQIRSGLISSGWEVKYIESNCRVKDGTISIYQPNNALGFMLGTFLRFCCSLFMKYDMLFVQTITPLTIPAILAAKVRKKKIVIDWDDLSWVLQKNRMREFLVRFSEHNFMRFADLVFVPNKYLLEYGVKKGAKKIMLAPHGVNYDVFDQAKYDSNAERNKIGIKNRAVIGFLASFTTGGVGDLDFIFEAVKKVIQKEPDTAFLVVGGGPLYLEYRKMAESMGLKNTYFTGLVNQNDVPKFISCMDIALIFMRDNLKNKMKTSLKVGEYLAMNKLVVGHLAGQTKDDFSGKCLLSEPSMDSFVKSICEALKKIPYRVNYREEMIKTYNWQITAGIIDKTLRAI